MQSQGSPSSRASTTLRSLAYIFFSQCVWSLASLVTTHLMGLHSTSHLSALSAAMAFWTPLSWLIGGILSNALPLMVQARAKGQKEARDIIWQFFWIATMLSLLGLTAFQWKAPLLGYFTSRDEAVLAMALRYLAQLQWGLPAYCLLHCLKALTEGCGQWKSSGFIGALGFCAQTGLSTWALRCSFRDGGEPLLARMGTIHACTYGLMALTYVLLIHTHRGFYRKYLGAATFRPKGPSWKQLLNHFSVGSLTGLSGFVECLAFQVLGLNLLRRYGEIAISAHQIVYQISFTLYLLPSALGTACMVQWSQAIGSGATPAQLQQQWAQHRRKAWLLGLLNGGGLILLARCLPPVFSQDPEVIQLCRRLIPFCVAYQIPDALLVLNASILKAYQDIPYLFLLQLSVYWGFALPLGLLLLKSWGRGPEGVWIAIALSILLALALSRQQVQKWIVSGKGQRKLAKPLSFKVVTQP